MKFFRFCMAVWIAVLIFLSFNCFQGEVNRSMLVFGMRIVDGNLMTARATSTDLKGIRYGSSFDQRNFAGDVSLEDYRPFDPSPSSKASVRHGTIEHGTPLMPYIPNPKPSPPPFDQDEPESP